MLWKKELVEAVVWCPFDGFKCDVRLSEECPWKIPGQHTQAYLWCLTLAKEELKRVIRRIFDFIEKDPWKARRKPYVCVPLGSVIYDSLWSHGFLPGSSVHGILQQEYWSGLPIPTPGDLSDPGSNPHLLHCRGILYHRPNWEAQGNLRKHEKKHSLLNCHISNKTLLKSRIGKWFSKCYTYFTVKIFIY